MVRKVKLVTMFVVCCRLPVVSDCSPQAGRVSTNHPGSGMAVSRVPSPPPQESNTPVAENWCYTQVNIHPVLLIYLSCHLPTNQPPNNLIYHDFLLTIHSQTSPLEPTDDVTTHSFLLPPLPFFHQSLQKHPGLKSVDLWLYRQTLQTSASANCGTVNVLRRQIQLQLIPQY